MKFHHRIRAGYRVVIGRRSAYSVECSTGNVDGLIERYVHVPRHFCGIDGYAAHLSSGGCRAYALGVLVDDVPVYASLACQLNQIANIVLCITHRRQVSNLTLRL